MVTCYYCNIVKIWHQAHYYIVVNYYYISTMGVMCVCVLTTMGFAGGSIIE